MRCHICDRVLDEPKFNKDIDGYEPCDPCLTVIFDAVGASVDKPYAGEDDLPDEGTWAAVLARSEDPEEP